MSNWKTYTKFVDDIGTTFEKLSNNDTADYRFVTPEGDADFCTAEQMEEWGVMAVEIIED
jgi:hypothetical protein